MKTNKDVINKNQNIKHECINDPELELIISDVITYSKSYYLDPYNSTEHIQDWY